MDTRFKIDNINKNIEYLQNKKKEIQDSCEHKNTEEVDYMWRPGATDKVLMCTDCDYIVKSVAENHIETVIYTSTDNDSYDGNMVGRNWKDDDVTNFDGNVIKHFRDW